MTSPSSTKSENSFIVVFFVLIVLCVCGGAAYYIHNQNQIVLKEEQQSQLETQKKKNEHNRQELQALFDTYLNNFKSELREKATDYKNTRIVLKDIKNPYNFETPEYAKENYDLFKKSIAPSLRQKASGIIGVFETYNKKIESNLKDKGNDLQRVFLEKWKEMSQKQLTKYVAFFSKEEELIQAYDDLITFYYVHSRRYEVDVETDQFTFSRKEDERKATELLERVNTLQKSSQQQK